MTSNSKAKWLTRTALLLALTIIFQAIRILFPALSLVNFGIINLSTLIIGSLVNLTLLISARYVGPVSGVVISIVSPIIAFFQGHLPIPHMIVVVAIGNLILVLVYYFVTKKLPEVTGLVAAAVIKFVVLWALVTYLVVPLFVKADKLKAVLSAGFSWPQLITALVAGVLALVIFPALNKALVKE